MELWLLLTCCTYASGIGWTGRGGRWRSWNLFAQRNDDATMRAMMAAFVDKSRKVDGISTSLLDVGYLSVGMDDGFQREYRLNSCG